MQTGIGCSANKHTGTLLGTFTRWPAQTWVKHPVLCCKISLFVLGAALDTVTEPVVPKGYRKTRDAGRNQCGMSSGGGGRLKSRATTLQESRSSRGPGLPSQGQGPLEMVSSNPPHSRVSQDSWCGEEPEESECREQEEYWGWRNWCGHERLHADRKYLLIFYILESSAWKISRSVVFSRDILGVCRMKSLQPFSIPSLTISVSFIFLKEKINTEWAKLLPSTLPHACSYENNPEQWRC